MAPKKKIKALVKLQLHAGKATPAPPVGTALGPHGVNMQEFCAQFNEKTRPLGETVIPVVVTIYEDRTLSFITKQPPAANLIRQTLGLAKGSGEPNKNKIGTITDAQIEEVAKKKMPDLNAKDLAGAKKMIEGTAKNMGLKIGN